jgi:hypothetical protein
VEFEWRQAFIVEGQRFGEVRFRAVYHRSGFLDSDRATEVTRGRCEHQVFVGVSVVAEVSHVRHELPPVCLLGPFVLSMV